MPIALGRGIAHRLPTVQLSRMESPEHERAAIEGYMASQAYDEKVVHLEKVASERVIGQDHGVWDVHTDKARWWVITEPTSLYAQSEFPSMDVALSFHVGLTGRVRQRAQSPEQEAPFAEAWRKWKQAAEVLNSGDEAEAFQSVGMYCRESLIAFVRTASEVVPLPPEVTRPYAADVKGWADVLGNVVAAGDSDSEHRSYLKTSTKQTWDLVNWLTHYADATRYHAQLAHRATEHALINWSLAIMDYDGEGPLRCDVCRSYKLRVDYESEGLAVFEFLVCNKCGWRSDRVFFFMDEEEEETGPTQAPPEGECVTVDVPLRPPSKHG
jgi:hypothetical protein